MDKMDKNYISASELKERISEVLNSVHFEKKVAIIERYGKPVAKIVPFDTKKNVSSLVDKYFGILPDFPDVTKDRKSRKNPISL